MRWRFIPLLPAIVCALIAAPASAHYAGQVLEIRDGDTLAEVGVDATDILPKRDTLFSAALFQHGDSLRWSFFPYDVLTVRATDGNGKAVFEKTFPAHADPQTYFDIVFPGAGVYDLRLSYTRDGASVLEGSVQLTVSSYFILDAFDWMLLYVLIAGAYAVLVARGLRSLSAA